MKKRFKAGDRVQLVRDPDFPQNVGTQLIILGEAGGGYHRTGHGEPEWECRPLTRVWSWDGLYNAEHTLEDIACFDHDLVKVK